MTEYILAAAVAAVAIARLTRLVIFDSFPPSAWLRGKWESWTEGSSWSPLLQCQYCLAPWLTAADIVAGLASDLHATWWVVNAWLAVSYVASIVVAYDGDD